MENESCRFTVTNVLREHTAQTAVRGFLKYVLLFYTVGNSEYLRTNHLVHISSIAPSSRWCSESLPDAQEAARCDRKGQPPRVPGRLGRGEYSPARGDTGAPPSRLLTHTGWSPRPPAEEARGPTPRARWLPRSGVWVLHWKWCLVFEVSQDQLMVPIPA